MPAEASGVSGLGFRRRFSWRASPVEPFLTDLVTRLVSHEPAKPGRLHICAAFVNPQDAIGEKCDVEGKLVPYRFRLALKRKLVSESIDHDRRVMLVMDSANLRQWDRVIRGSGDE